jgi:hypothetical protein
VSNILKLKSLPFQVTNWLEECHMVAGVFYRCGFHFIGEKKHGGIVLPNDGQCHLEHNVYTMSHYYVSA